jgi:hypothetical protein
MPVGGTLDLTADGTVQAVRMADDEYVVWDDGFRPPGRSLADVAAVWL